MTNTLADYENPLFTDKKVYNIGPWSVIYALQGFDTMNTGPSVITLFMAVIYEFS
jgi:hypothetical protein